MSDDHGAAPVRFADLTRVELRARADRGVTVLVPLGATEQHGPHLPADTDTFLAESMCLACAERLDDVIVAPAVPWGLSHGHLPLGGTITLQPATYLTLLTDICESLIGSGFVNQVWVNGHNSNKSIQAALVYEAQRRWGVGLGAVSYYDFAGPHLADICATGDFHAGEMETSLVQAFDASRVREVPEGTGTMPSRLTSFDPLDVSNGGPALVGAPYTERFPDGVAGDPSQASAETGRKIIDVALDGLVRFVSEYAAYRKSVEAPA